MYIYNRLGTYGSIEDAAKAHDRAALDYQGDKAKLNYPALYNVYLKELEEQRFAAVCYMCICVYTCT